MNASSPHENMVRLSEHNHCSQFSQEKSTTSFFNCAVNVLSGLSIAWAKALGTKFQRLMSEGLHANLYHRKARLVRLR